MLVVTGYQFLEEVAWHTRNGLRALEFVQNIFAGDVASTGTETSRVCEVAVTCRPR